MLEVTGLIIVVAAIIVALAGTGALGAVAPSFGDAVCRVLGGNCGGGPKPPGKRETGPAAAPKHTCLLNQRQLSGEATVEVPLRYFTVRGGGKAALAIRKIRDSEGKIRYQVQVLEGKELSAQTPGGPDDPKLWGGLYGEKGKIYQFDSEKDANQFAHDLPLKMVREKAYDSAKNSNPILRGLDWAGNKVTDGGLRRTATGLPDPKTQYYEGGFTAGGEVNTEKFSALKDRLKFAGKGKVFRLAGIRHDRGTNPGSGDDTNTAYLKFNNEAAAEATVNLPYVTELIRKGLDSPAIEAALEKKLGFKPKIPPAVVTYLKKAGLSAGLAIKAKPNVTYELDMDANGNPKKLRQINDTTYVFTVKPSATLSPKELKSLQALNDKLKFADHNKLGSVGVDTELALWGSRNVTTKDLDLTQPGNGDVALRALADGALNPPMQSMGGLGPDSLYPTSYQALQKRFETNGGVSKQHYDVDSLAFNFNLKNAGGKYKTKGGARRQFGLTVGLSGEKQRLTEAEYWDPSQHKWVPWKECGG